MTHLSTLVCISLVLGCIFSGCTSPESLMDPTESPPPYSPETVVIPQQTDDFSIDFSSSDQNQMFFQDMQVSTDQGDLQELDMTPPHDLFIPLDQLVSTDLDPDMYVDPLSSHLSIPECVASLNGECLVFQRETGQDRCDQWNAILQDPPSYPPLSNPNTCELEETPLSSIRKAQSYLNLLRSWLQIPSITIRQNALMQYCALGRRLEQIEGVWDDDSRCYSEGLNQNLQDADTAAIYGGWSPLEVSEILLGLTRIEAVERTLESRHRLYDAELTELQIGRYQKIECDSPRFNRMTPVNQPFSVYPGLGTLPLEMVNPGNRHRGTVPWSISLKRGTYTDFHYEVVQIVPSLQELHLNRFSLAPQSKVYAFKIRQPIQEGDVYRIDMSWTNEENQPQTANAYLAFQSCGSILPNEECNPLDMNPCPMPGFSCIYRGTVSNRTPQWLCSRVGPMEQYEVGCTDLGQSCQPGLVCLNNELYPEGICGPYCDLESNQWNSCEQVCQGVNTSLLSAPQFDFGSCYP